MRERLAPAWADVDLLLVNGEGTIHHDSIGALALSGLCAAAKGLRKRVALVNCSILALSEPLLDTLRQSVDYFSVREPVTFRYLRDCDIPATQSADCLFLASQLPETHHPAPPRLPSGGSYVVYTPGVLTACGQINGQTINADIKAIRSLGHDVVYYVVEIEDERFCLEAAQAGASILPLGALRWNHVQRLLSGAEWVVSGRYHINIFSSLAGTPFVPLETNTSKMGGLLELLGEHGSKSIRSWKNAESSADLPSLIGPGAGIKVSNGKVRECATMAELSASFATRPAFAKTTPLAPANKS